jgi:hypothetical protein
MKRPKRSGSDATPRKVEPAASSETIDERKACGLAVLKEKHGLDYSTMSHRDWRRLYVRGASPNEAAEAAWRFQENMRRPSERTRRR